MLKQEFENIISYLETFNKEYLVEGLGMKNRLLPKKIDIQTTLEDGLDFDFEEIDVFVCFLSEKEDLNISGFYMNTHIQGMSYELALLPTKLLFPFVGLKKWMVFKEESRVLLTLGDLAKAIKSKVLSSEEIFREAERNKYQEKVYQILKKVTQ
jgi:hypothetical protein